MGGGKVNASAKTLAPRPCGLDVEMTDKQKSPEEIAWEIVQDWSGWDQDDMSDTFTQDLIKRIAVAIRDRDAYWEKRVGELVKDVIQETREYAESRLEELDDHNSNMAGAYIGYVEACDRIEEAVLDKFREQK